MKERTSFKDTVQNSVIIKFINAITNVFSSMFSTSVVGGTLISEGMGESLFANSAIKTVYGKRSRRNSGVKKFRRFVSASVEKSRIIRFIQSLSKLFFGLKLRTVGSFFLSYALFASIVLAIIYYPFETNGSFVQFFTLIVMAAISLPFILSKQNIAHILSESKMLSAVFEESLGVDFEQKTRDAKHMKIKSKYFGIAPIAGIVCALLSFKLQPLHFALFIAVMITVMFTKPL